MQTGAHLTDFSEVVSSVDDSDTLGELCTETRAHIVSLYTENCKRTALQIDRVLKEASVSSEDTIFVMHHLSCTMQMLSAELLSHCAVVTNCNYMYSLLQTVGRVREESFEFVANTLAIECINAALDSEYVTTPRRVPTPALDVYTVTVKLSYPNANLFGVKLLYRKSPCPEFDSVEKENWKEYESQTHYKLAEVLSVQEAADSSLEERLTRDLMDMFAALDLVFTSTQLPAEALPPRTPLSARG